ISFTIPGTAATLADPPFEWGDVISAVDGQQVKSYAELTAILASQTSDVVKLDVRGEGAESKRRTITIKDNCFRTLGLSMDTGPIAAVQDDSPADLAGLKKGDKLASINGRNIGTEINPLKLPKEFYDLRGQEVTVTVTRQTTGGGQTKEDLKITPVDRPGWTEQPIIEGEPLSIPSIGVAFHTIPVVLAVEPDSPAAKAEIKSGPLTRLKKIELVLPKETEAADRVKKRDLVIDLDGAENKSNNWCFAFWQMQELPQRTVRLTLSEGDQVRTVELTPALDRTWPLPMIQGLRMHAEEIRLQATSLGDAWSMSTNYTRNSALSIYLTLRGLCTGQVALANLSGPLGI
ncbi:MAG: PDZ domain-containing protein, partial [Planctomycetes bacterium]|nr:PDZ domain-containing protein [Planctomycetota bacterium]